MREEMPLANVVEGILGGHPGECRDRYDRREKARRRISGHRESRALQGGEFGLYIYRKPERSEKRGHIFDAMLQ
jgi:hypothetical protein